jgi:hypothetical protein
MSASATVFGVTQLTFILFGAVALWIPALLARRRPMAEFWLTAAVIPASALAGSVVVEIMRSTTPLAYFTIIILPYYFLGGTLSALVWAFSRARRVRDAHSELGLFDPRWVIAVPASAWVAALVLAPVISGAYRAPAVALLQLVVIVGLRVARGTPSPPRPVAPAMAHDAPEPVAAKVKVDPAPPVNTASPGPRLFISYRREDSAYITDRINERLTQRFGRNAVFKDVDSIPLGQDFRKLLRDAVGGCDVLLAVIGKEWFAVDAKTGKRRIDDPRDHLRIEIESALERDIPVIPVLVQGAEVPEEEQLPEPLRPLAYRNAQPVRPDPDFNNDLDRLMRGIETQLRS